MGNYQSKNVFYCFYLQSCSKITIDQVQRNKSKLKSFLIKYLILSLSVEIYEWFSAKYYNEWQILNTVAFLSQTLENSLGICKAIKCDPIYSQL